jgi:hypothetical protein
MLSRFVTQFVLLLSLCSCASQLPPIPNSFADKPEEYSHAESMGKSLETVVDGWGNLGRLNAVERRAEELGLGEMMRTEFIDWFSLQQNLIIDLPGRSPQLIYVIAHYDKTDLNPLKYASLLLNGLLDDLIPFPSISQGALDNGTGVAVALELANTFAHSNHFLSYRFLFPGAEESGLRGTRAHLAGLSTDEKAWIRMAVNIDTVGVDFASNCLFLDPMDPLLQEEILAAAKRTGAEIEISESAEEASSDYAPFRSNGFQNDFPLGFKLNYIGGILPQKSWFGTSFSCPAVNFSACGLTGPQKGETYLSHIHGPLDTLAGVNFTRLHEQYALVFDFLRGKDKAAASQAFLGISP